MNRKFLGLMAGLVFALTSSVAQAFILINGGTEATTDLVRTGGTIFGDVTLSTDGTGFFSVAYSTKTGWALAEANIWMGDDLNDLPTGMGGNPTPGLFPIQAVFDPPALNATFSIPFSDVGFDPSTLVGDVTWYLAAHAIVTDSSDFETTWADGDTLVGTRDVPVFSVTISSVSVPEPGTLALFGLGLAGLGFAGRPRRS